MDGTHGAGSYARATVEALTGINYCFAVHNRNGFYRTNIDTTAATDADIRINLRGDALLFFQNRGSGWFCFCNGFLTLLSLKADISGKRNMTIGTTLIAAGVSRNMRKRETTLGAHTLLVFCHSAFVVSEPLS